MGKKNDTQDTMRPCPNCKGTAGNKDCRVCTGFGYTNR